MRYKVLVLPSINTDILNLGKTATGKEEVQSEQILDVQSEIQKEVMNLMKSMEKLRSFNQTNLGGVICSLIAKGICLLIPF